MVRTSTSIMASNATSPGRTIRGTHMDPLVTRLLFWLVYTLAAVILLVSMLRIFPPPTGCSRERGPSRSGAVVLRGADARLRRHRLREGS